MPYKAYKCRFIAPIADSSALAGLSDTSLHLLNRIIAPIADVSALVGITLSRLLFETTSSAFCG
jgi:hypothetical protein